MMRMLSDRKSLEIVFLTVFSIASFVLFFSLLSVNGLVLGNDPAVHLGRAEMLLAGGRIPLSDIAWLPPLYHIVLATLITFTGAMTVEQMLFLMKALTALIDWLLLFSVYLVGAKFLGKKYGVLAASLMLLSFPLYEINFWGGYTGILSLAFISLLFLYFSLGKRDFGSILVTFILAFSLVLSHQLATFLAVIILPLFLIIMFAKSRGHFSKAWLAAILGGALAFFIYYFQAIWANLDVLISHVFFGIKTYLYQVPSVSAHSFMINFGFILFFAALGVFLGYFRLKKEKKLGGYLILSLSLFIPLFLSQSYLFGLYLPYQWFVYFLMPPLVVFAAVAFSFIIDLFFDAYRRIKFGRKRLMQIASVSLVLLVLFLLLARSQVLGSRINESFYYYSTTDMAGYNAAVWLRENFPDAANVTATEKPGSWFGLYSGKFTIAATNPIIDRNIVAESVLDLSYEIEHPLTMIRAYSAKGNISDENHVSINNVWRRVSYLSAAGIFLNFTENNRAHYSALSNLNREIIFEEKGYPKRFIITYFNDEIALTESILVQNDSYPVEVAWTLSPLRSEIHDVTLYVSYFFDLYFKFEKAYVPGSLNGENPWSKPSIVNGNEWAVVTFSKNNLTDNYIGAYDDTNEIAFALKFADLPEWGNVGALSSRQVDAFRFEYRFDSISINHTASFAYQILTFSKSSYPDMPRLGELENLFDFRSATAFHVTTRNYVDYIKEFNLEFLVYDKNRFDSKLLTSPLLQLVYSNDKYVVCRIKK
ncbi:MAG: hypothetical protein NWE94_09895 [Candidatus Bathyarchaeota archaeon]|nr:hypothetical protein [Candidatus Bathyarchaeota archaeon]